MAMWFQKEKPAVTDDKPEPYDLSKEYAEAGREAWINAPEKRLQYQDELDRQTAGYTFECRRFGDFLTVFIGREANPEKENSWDVGRTFSTTLNLALVRSIGLTPGKPVHTGKLSFSVRECANNGVHAPRGGFTGSKPRDGYHWEVVPIYPDVPQSRSMCYVEPQPQQVLYGGGGGGFVFTGTYGSSDHGSIQIEDFPQPSSDDRIVFSGLDATIFAPFGSGQKVIDVILAEIAAKAPTRERW